MRRLRGLMLGLVVAAGAAGCGDQLVVENTNSPDRTRALARPTDVENLVAGQFRVIHNAFWGTAGNVDNLVAQLAVMGMESYSANANFGMNVRSPIPRSLIDNSRGNPADFYDSFLALNQAARAAALGLSRLNAPDFTFFPADANQVRRARAFGYLAKGVAQGYLAMVFDSNAVISPEDDPQANNPLVGYDSVMRAALNDLDSAIAIASAATFTLPNAAGQLTWIPSPTNLTGGAAGTFVRFARSFKARFRAGVARNPAERAGVDWVSVIADANAGLTADFEITMANVTGGWFYRPMQMDLFQSWHQMWSAMLGMADTSGAYQTWLATPRANKTRFVVATPDRRFPTGTTSDAQRTSSGCGSAACLQPGATAPLPFFRHRPSGENVDVDGLAMGFYDFYRFQALWNANRNGNVIVFTKAELDLLAAEGYIRTGDFANAAAKIDISRTARGLPSVGALADLTTLVPGGSACVPKVPTGATNALAETPTTVACGNIMEAMKWEKRLEMAYIYPGGWYFDGRGWGDLPAGTQTQFPVPYTELDSRLIPIYSGISMDPVTSVSANNYTAAARLSNSTSNYGLGH